MDPDTLSELLAVGNVTVTSIEYNPGATVLEIIEQAAADELG